MHLHLLASLLFKEMIKYHMFPWIFSIIEPQLSGPRLSGLFDYPDFILKSQFSHEY